MRLTNDVLVMATIAKLPLVLVGGRRELSEEYFDTCHAIDGRAGVPLAFYNTMLMGGEPYGDWL